MGDNNLLTAGMSMTEEQQAMPLRDAVFMSLRKAILTGKINPGERLTEVKLGKILGTSRTPIREAIRLLEQENLVTIIPGSGARVSRMTVSDLQDVMEVRSALEQLSAGLACERITEEEGRRRPLPQPDPESGQKSETRKDSGRTRGQHLPLSV